MPVSVPAESSCAIVATMIRKVAVTKPQHRLGPGEPTESKKKYQKLGTPRKGGNGRSLNYLCPQLELEHWLLVSNLNHWHEPQSGEL